MNKSYLVTFNELKTKLITVRVKLPENTPKYKIEERIKQKIEEWDYEYYDLCSEEEEIDFDSVTFEEEG